MSKNQNTLLDRQTFSFKAVTNEVELSNSGVVFLKVTGISLIPEQFRIQPLEIKNNLIKKSTENEIDIQNQLFSGNYYVNVLDYTLGEITFAANLICEKWCENIWKYLISKPEDFQPTITLTEKAIKEQLVRFNSNLFNSIKDVEELCKKYNLDINSFVESAKFSQLKMELEGVSARLASEIFFFRKKLFAELFIQKIDSKIYSYEKAEQKKINTSNNEIYNNWKTNQLNEIQSVQKYIKSPFIFEDFEQFFSYKSIEDFVPHDELQQDLVSETFYWINSFEKVKERFTRAVELYNEKSDFVDCVNNLRLTLELLVKRILNNNKSLEKQLGEIGIYQERLGIGVEIRNTFNKLLDYYNKYQNNRVKHDTDIKSQHEVEFIFGLTMIFIRMLIKPNYELNNK